MIRFIVEKCIPVSSQVKVSRFLVGEGNLNIDTRVKIPNDQNQKKKEA